MACPTEGLSNINTEYSGSGGAITLSNEKPQPQESAARSQERFFKSRNRDGDGAITLEEFIGNPEGRNGPALTKRFKKIDSNGDGKLQQDDVKEEELK
jgi:hypothetical protein